MNRQPNRAASKRGRPPLAWLTPEALRTLPLGTAVAVETRGRRDSRLVGRIATVTDHTLTIAAPAGTVELTDSRVRRGRVLASVYEPGDPVLKRHVPASDWRGGVVRTEGTEVLVEQMETAPDGSMAPGFAWVSEALLEPASARDPDLPPLKRGPVPARAVG